MNTTFAMGTVPTGIEEGAATVLVVHEGEARLRWVGSAADWSLVGMWPDAEDRRMLAEHLRAGRPLLVVLDAAAPTVTIWRHELRMPESAFQAVADDGDLLEVTVPFLEWLPDDLRERGHRFCLRASAMAQRTPAALQPAVIVEEPALVDSSIRFAWRSRRAQLGEDELRRVADWVFNGRAAA
jgi:hypothetical protein